jgi:hypothetical protein
VEDLLGDGGQKWVLRDPACSRLPEAIRLRVEKIAFATPGERWWRGPLREWLHDVLDAATLRRHGLLDPHVVATALDHLAADAPEAGRPPFWRWANLTMWVEARGRQGSRPS